MAKKKRTKKQRIDYCFNCMSPFERREVPLCTKEIRIEVTCPKCGLRGTFITKKTLDK